MSLAFDTPHRTFKYLTSTLRRLPLHGQSHVKSRCSHMTPVPRAFLSFLALCPHNLPLPPIDRGFEPLPNSPQRYLQQASEMSEQPRPAKRARYATRPVHISISKVRLLTPPQVRPQVHLRCQGWWRWRNILNIRDFVYRSIWVLPRGSKAGVAEG
jgi:hypothetical protein